jgi:uncharacterized protein
MSARIVDRHSARQLPWKNGLGVTLELAIAPDGATLDDFDWRISSAKVASAGAFSHFPGIDRSLGLLDGAGLRLLLPGQTLQLDAHNPLASFPGELAIQAELLDGAITDLNLMSRRGRWLHRLQHQQLDGTLSIDSAAVMLIYCQSGAPLECRGPDTPAQSLGPGQGLLLEAEAGPFTLSNQGNSQLFLAWLERV